MSKPMVLTKENVIATMEGRKNMSRRIINDSCLQSIKFDEISPVMNTPPHQHDNGKWYYELQSKVDDTDHFEIKPRYQIGDEVYVAEGYQMEIEGWRGIEGKYLADGEKFCVRLNMKEYKLWLNRKYPCRPTPGRFMYKSLARTLRTITGVGVERVQDISEEDAKAEGIPEAYGILKPRAGFKRLWNSIHGPGAWERNDWVFVYKWE